MSQSWPQGPYGELAESGVAVVALAEIELARVHRAMDSFMQRRRPPAHIRSSVDIAFRIPKRNLLAVDPTVSLAYPQ